MKQPLRIDSARHPLIAKWCALRDRRPKQCDEEQVLVEGATLIKELAPLIVPIALIANTEQALEGFHKALMGSCREAVTRFLLSERAMKRLSDVVTPQGCCMICKVPQRGHLNPDQRWLICDRIADPGNLGTLIRTACALEWDGVYLLGNCCDPFNAKALRAGRGSAFKIPLDLGDHAKLVQQRTENTQLFIACAQGEKTAPQFFSKGGLWLALGNESHGVCPKLKALGKLIAIRARGMESLNVACAGAILMHAFAGRSAKND